MELAYVAFVAVILVLLALVLGVCSRSSACGAGRSRRSFWDLFD